MFKQNWLHYPFETHPPNVDWNDVPGVYIFAKLNQSQDAWLPLYIGIAESFKKRFGSHERWDEAVRKGAHSVHAMVEHNGLVRKAVEAHLIQHFQPPMNVQLKEASLSALMKLLGNPNPYFPLDIK